MDEPGFVEANLLEWKTGTELEDRASVVDGCANFAKEIRSRSQDVSLDAIAFIRKCFPEQMAASVKGERFSPDHFFRFTLQQVGEFRSDRTTVRSIGQLWTAGNRTRFASALKYAFAREGNAPKLAVWVKPRVPHWGATTRIREIIGAVERQAMETDDTTRPTLQTVLISNAEGGQGLSFKHIFGSVVQTGSSGLPGGLEVFVIPDRFAYVALHTPIGQVEGYPIPLGIMTFDLQLVRKVQRQLARSLEDVSPSHVHCSWGSTDVLGDLHHALLEVPEALSQTPHEKVPHPST